MSLPDEARVQVLEQDLALLRKRCDDLEREVAALWSRLRSGYLGTRERYLRYNLATDRWVLLDGRTSSEQTVLS